MTTDQLLNHINHGKQVCYKNAAINAKQRIGSANFYRQALETIRYYQTANSHKVTTIQAYCNLMGYSNEY